MIRFSVIIPVYNRSHLIAETISTVLVQTYPQFEIIIVDDGSSEDIKKVLDDNFPGEDKIRYFYKQNGERAAARNFGLQKATGDFAVFFDSDDWMKPGYLETLSNKLTADPSVNLIAAKYNYRDGAGNERRATISDLKEGWYDRDYFLRGNYLACNFCIRCKNFNYRPFPEERELITMEDWLFLLLNLADNRLFIIDKICVQMRMHDERSMSDNQKIIKTKLKAVEWIETHTALTDSQKRKLRGWAQYFSGVHLYLDQQRVPSFRSAIRAMQLAGINKKFILLVFKSLIGKKIMHSFR